MYLEDIIIKIQYYLSNGSNQIDLKSDILEICNIIFVKTENILSNQIPIAHLELNDKKLNAIGKYSICMSYNINNKLIFLKSSNPNFYLRAKIMAEDKTIGGASFSKFIVDDKLLKTFSIKNAEDEEEFSIVNYILESNFNSLYKRAVGILDELILSDEYSKLGLSTYALLMLYSFINAWEFDIDYLYTQPKASRKDEYYANVLSQEHLSILLDAGFVLADANKYILRKEIKVKPATKVIEKVEDTASKNILSLLKCALFQKSVTSR